MQRLFSGFPNSLPGAGLLVLRLALGFVLFVHSCVLCGLAQSFDGVLQIAVIVVACLILLGLATPFAAGVGVLVSFGLKAPFETHILIAATDVSLILLGPGAWSADARLFGRRRIDLSSL